MATKQNTPKQASTAAKSPTAKVKAEKKLAKKPLQRKRSPKSTYDQARADEIISRLSTGEPLRQICRSEHMPTWYAAYDWMESHPEFKARIARAREVGEEAILQDCLQIADDATNDWMETHGQDDVGYKLNGEHVQRSKLRIDTRLKLLAKWNPKKWGDKVDLNHGVQPENPLAKLFEQVAGTALKPASD